MYELAVILNFNLKIAFYLIMLDEKNSRLGVIANSDF